MRWLSLLLVLVVGSNAAANDLFNFGVDDSDRVEVYAGSPFLALIQDGYCPGGNCPLPFGFAEQIPVPVNSSGSRPIGSGYSAQWTWPGDLGEHLKEHVDQMSASERMAWHDALHNGGGVQGSFSSNPGYYRRVETYSSGQRPVGPIRRIVQRVRNRVQQRRAMGLGLFQFGRWR